MITCEGDFTAESVILCIAAPQLRAGMSDASAVPASQEVKGGRVVAGHVFPLSCHGEVASAAVRRPGGGLHSRAMSTR